MMIEALLEQVRALEQESDRLHAQHMDLAELTFQLARLVGDLERRVMQLEAKREE